MVRSRESWGRYLTWAFVLFVVLFLAWRLRLLLSTVLTGMVAPAVGPLVPLWAQAGRAGELLRFAFHNVVALAVLLVAYRFLHRALRLRFVERLVVATSLTHFGFWRRYRAPKRAASAPQVPSKTHMSNLP